MPELLRFLHVAAVLGFMLLHGSHMTVMWRLRGEPDPDRALTMFNGLYSVNHTRLALAAIVLTGIASTFVQESFGRAWIWASILLLAAIAAAMWRWGGGYYGVISAAADRAFAARDAGVPTETWQAEYDAARTSHHTLTVSAIGLIGLAAILWLMVFKPF